MTYVLGTAGHVDHGKSTLVHALTGIDPDRLREEKERGLTIDLGFAWLQLPSGRDVSIVDVPGHERFIKNMLAGAGGIDLALMVVAADEGPMPQTREHLAILDLLDIPAGIAVLTRTDLVDDEFASLVEAELTDVFAGTMLQGAPVVRVSALTGAGIPHLLECIDQALAATPPKRDLGRPRLPIDRAFTIQGFGTVVTGTLVDGAFAVGQEVEIQPGGKRARVRGLQRHKTKVSRLEPGTRAAVNLSGVHADDIARGMVLTQPGTLPPAWSVDIRLRATSILAHPLAHDAGVTFLSATSETEAKLRLLDCDSLRAGEECWAQAVLEQPIAVRRGDRCVLRTPNETAAGGAIVAVNSRRHRRRHMPTLAALERLLAGSPAEQLLDLLAAGPLEAQAIASRLTLEPGAASALVSDLTASGQLISRGALVFSAQWLDAAGARIAAATAQYHEANPLRPAAPREHVRSATGVAANAFDAALVRAVEAGHLRENPEGLATPDHEPTLSPAQATAAARFLSELEAGGCSPPTTSLLEPPLLAYLSQTGKVVDTGAGVVFSAAVFSRMVEQARRHMLERGPLSLAETRDLFGTSRKYAQAFLEHLDALHITRRVGEARVLLSGGEYRP
jgi:selenocysteine-specific elongation factor